MKVLLIPNFSKVNAENVVDDVCNRLNDIGITPLLNEDYKGKYKNYNCEYKPFFVALEECDLIIAVGGDGTIIHSAKHAAIANKPILGVNLGRLGFLASLEVDEIDLLSKLVDKDYTIDKRMMLKATHTQGNKTTIYNVFNDVVVTKGSLSRIIDLEINCDKKPVGKYRADGIIFATPSGGTAYSISAGGPIVEPSIECIIMTPICPHSLMARSIIFPSDKQLEIVAPTDNPDIYITVDGEKAIRFNESDSLIIEKSDLFVKLININKREFYDVLNQKFLM